jgi:hypothetical protein
MSSRPSSSTRKWQWDIVTWSFILLVVVAIVLFWIALWPHGFGAVD